MIQITIDHICPLAIPSLANPLGMLHKPAQIQKSGQLIILGNNTKNAVFLLNLFYIPGHLQPSGRLCLAYLQIMQGQTNLQANHIEEREILLVNVTGQKSILLLPGKKKKDHKLVALFVLHQITDSVFLHNQRSFISRLGNDLAILIAGSKMKVIRAGPLPFAIVNNRFIQKKKMSTSCMKLPHFLHNFLQKSLLVIHAVV